MAIPRATVTARNVPGVPAPGEDFVCLFAPVASNADHKPRAYGNTDTMTQEHGFGDHVEYAALHFARTRGRVLLCPLPIAEPGVISREDTTGNSDSSSTTLSEDADGILSEHDGILRVAAGGTIGTDQIFLDVSLDRGMSFRRVRLGTANSLHFDQGFTLSFGAGDLTAGETIHRWHGSAPKSDATGWAAAFNELEKELYQFRSVLLIGDADPTETGQFLTLVNAYAVEVDRYVYGRVNATDRSPFAQMSSTVSRMAPGTALTFDGTTDAVTRSTGSWLAEGYRVGDYVTVAGTASNNGTFLVTALTATVMTFEADDLTNETIGTATVTGRMGLEFDATADTITRSRGSWIADGFVTDTIATVTGTASNNVSLEIEGVTATVLSLANGLANEDVSSAAVSVSSGQTMAAWAAATVDAYAGIDAEFRIDIGMGRYPTASPVTNWLKRMPAAWLASAREYSLPEHVATWRKGDGAVAIDESRNPAFQEEYDDRIFNLGNTNRFTTLRTWANGPRGVFICTSRTRGLAGTQLSQTHQVAVFNKCLRIVQQVTESFIGRNVELDEVGRATAGERDSLESEVASALDSQVMVDVRGEGRQASSVKWTMSEDDALNTPEATVTGFFEINFNGTIFAVDTIAKAS